jgi:hypothetical protein
MTAQAPAGAPPTAVLVARKFPQLAVECERPLLCPPLYRWFQTRLYGQCPATASTLNHLHPMLLLRSVSQSILHGRLQYVARNACRSKLLSCPDKSKAFYVTFNALQ